MINFRPHEYALLFPAMSEDDLEKLAADIKENGLLNEIVLLDGKILDGVQRDTACKGAGVEPRYVNWDDFPEAVKAIGPLAYVYSQNIPRRHLTIEQRVEHALKLLPLLKEEARQRQLATQFKDGGKPVSVNVAGRKGKATAIAAEIAGVSTSTVERALREERSEPDDPESELPEIELHVREFATDVRNMISKILQHHVDWSYRQRAWLCSKAGSKLAMLARELSKQEKQP
jgi:hypothetical protein